MTVETFEPADYNKNGKVSKKEKARYEKESREELLNIWGISYALVKQDEQLYDWFNRKTKEYMDSPEGFSKEAFFLELDQQPFAQKYSAAAIADMDFESRFPDVWNDQINTDVENLRDQAIQIGAQMNDEQLRDLAVRKRRMGLSDAQVQNIFADYISAVDGVYQGTAGQTATGLTEWGRRNGIELSSGMVDSYLKRIQSGDITEFDVLQELRRDYLAGAYPAWADKINAGQDIYDIASPYRKRIADLLEVNVDDVDLNDQLLQRGLQSVGVDGKPRVMPLYEFEREIRSDPRWEYTDNAYETYAKVGTGLLRMFGFR